MSSTSLDRVAIVDHFSAGGVSRFLFALIANMARLHPHTTFTYFVAEENVVRDDLQTAFAPYSNVVVHPIRCAPVVQTDLEPVDRGALWRVSVGALKRMPRLHSALRGVFVAVKERVSPEPEPAPWYRYGLDEAALAEVAQNDVCYIGWPYWIEPFDIRPPVVATFHDFHYKHFPETYEPQRLEMVERQTPAWLQRCEVAVTSTSFIQSDLLAYYPDKVPRCEIVYIAPYGGVTIPGDDVVAEALKKLGVRHPFVLYSGALTAHKNMASLVRAVALMRDTGSPVQLVVTGHGTDRVCRCEGAPPSDPLYELGRAMSETGLRPDADYVALGYVSNSDVDALTVAADAVVSPSLYEAGCGPALDAWQMGVPVAFSGIPPFLEQMERFGVEAHVFDPRDPSDIAAKLHDAVFDVERSRAMARRSQVALQRYTWDDAAQGYFEILEGAVGIATGSLGASAESIHRAESGER